MWVLLTHWQNAPQAIMIDSQTKLDKERETKYIFLELEHNLKRNTFLHIILACLILMFISVGFCRESRQA